VLVSVGRVLDQVVLGELKALGLPASRFLDRSALLAVALGGVHQRLGRLVVFHDHRTVAPAPTIDECSRKFGARKADGLACSALAADVASA
jgi:hypothetical protein